MFFQKPKGIHAPHMKNTSNMHPVKMPVPATVTIPMSMHTGAPAIPVVKVGDQVKVGQLIGEGIGRVSAPIHSSVSGKVKKLDEITSSNGTYIPAVVIETDGLQTPYEGLAPHPVETLEDFLAAVRASGAVGLGGAAFPTAVKLDVDPEKVRTILVNGAECEPYITSDTRTMLGRSNDLWTGIKLLQKFYSPEKIIIGIEANKPECIALYQEFCKGDSGIEVQVLPSMYPQGSKQLLVLRTIGQIVPEGKRLLDVGAIIINVTTLAVVARYITTGMPLVERCVTVDGSAVAQPKNVLVPIGTSLQAVFDFCGGFKTEPRKVLYGGPMMGIAVPSMDVPVMKNTNAILAFNEEDSQTPPESVCIRCGRCISQCPLGLNPTALNAAYLDGDCEALDKLGLNQCMECGCCNYVCPASRQLVQSHKLAKALLRSYKKAQQPKKEKEAAAK